MQQCLLLNYCLLLVFHYGINISMLVKQLSYGMGTGIFDANWVEFNLESLSPGL